jgi:tRNA 2-thiouridine synthesizing protein D
MRYSLLVCAAPEHPAAQTALLTARAVLARGHQLERLFFYSDAVHLSEPASRGHDEWRDLIRAHDIDAVLCVSAAAERGISETDSVAPWNISGLGQWADALHHSDRVLSFG